MSDAKTLDELIDSDIEIDQIALEALGPKAKTYHDIMEDTLKAVVTKPLHLTAGESVYKHIDKVAAYVARSMGCHNFEVIDSRIEGDKLVVDVAVQPLDFIKFDFSSDAGLAMEQMDRNKSELVGDFERFHIPMKFKNASDASSKLVVAEPEIEKPATSNDASFLERSSFRLKDIKPWKTVCVPAENTPMPSRPVTLISMDGTRSEVVDFSKPVQTSKPVEARSLDELMPPETAPTAWGPAERLHDDVYATPWGPATMAQIDDINNNGRPVGAPRFDAPVRNPCTEIPLPSTLSSDDCMNTLNDLKKALVADGWKTEYSKPRHAGDPIQGIEPEPQQTLSRQVATQYEWKELLAGGSEYHEFLKSLNGRPEDIQMPLESEYTKFMNELEASPDALRIIGFDPAFPDSAAFFSKKDLDAAPRYDIKASMQRKREEDKLRRDAFFWPGFSETLRKDRERELEADLEEMKFRTSMWYHHSQMFHRHRSPYNVILDGLFDDPIPVTTFDNTKLKFGGQDATAMSLDEFFTSDPIAQAAVESKKNRQVFAKTLKNGVTRVYTGAEVSVSINGTPIEAMPKSHLPGLDECVDVPTSEEYEGVLDGLRAGVEKYAPDQDDVEEPRMKPSVNYVEASCYLCAKYRNCSTVDGGPPVCLSCREDCCGG